jgi:hypothetical protein
MATNNSDLNAANDVLQTFSKTCSTIYSKISKKQFEYLQAISILEEDMLGSCNGLVKNQVELIEEYSSRRIVSKDQMLPTINMINRFIEQYLNYISLEYDLVLARMRLHHKILTMINDSSPRLTEIYLEALKSIKVS